MEKTARKKLERAKFPEQVGVSSAEIAAFLKDLEESDIEMHGLMILRGGKVAFELWREPYSPEVPHTVYSVSKTFTSVAVGFAINEGYLSLETKLLDIFPEYRPQKKDVYLEKLNVRHLLTMTAGKNVSLLSDKSKGRWLQDFFDAPWYNEPGREWRYISENCYMLCAAIQRLTKMTVIDFLTPRLFEPLGFSKVPFWETDDSGIEAGGWGLYITTEDLARFALCFGNGGKFASRQVIPEEWVREASKKQVECYKYSELDNRVGYGYFIWRNGFVPNSYRMDGMFSQFAIIFEDYDAQLVINAGEISEQKTRDCIWRHFPRAFIKKSKTAPDTSDLTLTLPPLPNLPSSKRYPLSEKNFGGKRMVFDKPVINNTIGFPTSMLPIATLYMSADRAGNITDMVVKFSENECTVRWREGRVFNTIVCGMDGEPRKSKIHLGGIDFTMLSTAMWESADTLIIWTRPWESIGQRRLRLVFKNDTVKLYPSTYPDIRFTAQYIADSMRDFVTDESFADVLSKGLMKIYSVIEPTHKGKIG